MEFLPLDLTKTSSLTLVGNGENGTEKKLEEKDLLRRLGEHHGQFSGNGSVDCTLSLGFPSGGESSRKEGYCSKSTVAVSPQPWTRLKEVLGFNVKPMQGGAVVLKKGGHAGISTFVRRCSACETTQTPLWRNGPNGAKSLCNACGIRFKKEERRVTMMNGLANSQAKPKGGGHGKSPQEMLRSSKKPKFHLHLNSSPQL